jgi:ATP-binding cassette subfamily E protein 1
MASTRIAIVDPDKCQPEKCSHECKKKCPVEQQGIECVDIENVARSENIELSTESIAIDRKAKAKIIEPNCIGCGACAMICPFSAIKIINVPSEKKENIVHRYGENQFRLYKLPVPKMGQIMGLIGQNGIGKSSVINILSGIIRPNFEMYGAFDTNTKIKKLKNIADLETKMVLSKFKGSELHKYFTLLYQNKLRICVKSQFLEYYLEKINDTTTVEEFLTSNNEYKEENTEKYKEVIHLLELDKILSNKVKLLSGGEMQRLICAITALKKADVYIFDEPNNFLDIRQRLNVAHLIRSLSTEKNYVIVIDHDLSIIDYISDYICLMYGVPGAYGVVSIPYATPNAINIFFEGYIPAENLRFRQEKYTLKHVNDLTDIQIANDIKLEYESSVVKYDNFTMQIEQGTFPSSSSITVMLGQNGCGKTTFVKYLVSQLAKQKTISYKPQILDIAHFKLKNTDTTVRAFLYNTIAHAMTSQLFTSDVIKQLEVDKIFDKCINKLSGGEKQIVFIAHCLGQDSDIYLLDEPSSNLDIEKRVNATKVIKRFVMHNKKIAFVVEHDIMMAHSLALEINSQIVVFDQEIDKESQHKKSIANKPINFKDGMNKFLKQLDITFQTNNSYNRPRINKKGGQKDQEQKKNNTYYM